MVRHRTAQELRDAIPHIVASPRNNGTVEMIVTRPDKGLREIHESCRLTRSEGVDGDHWAKGCWLSTDDGAPHPDVAVCIMNSRCIDLIAGTRDRWALAGDNLFVDMNLSEENLPVGQRLVLGRAEIEITAVPHAGCQKFIDRFGRDACVFVNTTKHERLRGVYARVIRDGKVSQGDTLRKSP